MPFIKLTDPGSSETFLLQQVELDTKGNWPDYKLHAANGDIIIGPKAALDRQLPNLKAGAMEELVGSYITVSRSEKLGANGKPFWNLNVSSGAEAKAQVPSSKRLPPPSKPSKPMTSVFEDMVPEDDFVNAEDYQSIVWNTGDAPAAPAAPVAPARPSAGPTVSTSTAADDVIRYTRLLRDIATALNCAVTEPNVQGAAATLWIQWHKPAKGGY